MKRAVRYLRVSTFDQASDDRYGFPRQERVCLRSEAKHGLMVVATVTDVISGASESRDGLDSLPTVAAQHEAFALSLSEVDRLSRADFMTAYGLLKQLLGTGLDIYASDLRSRVNTRDPDSVREVNDRLRQAYDERVRTRERTYGGALEKVMRGQPIRPLNAYGYRDGEPYEPEARWVRWMAEQALNRGNTAIAAALNARGVPTATGGHWSKVAVGAILRNPLYAGRYLYGREGTCPNPQCGERYSGTFNDQVRGWMTCRRCGTRMAMNTQTVAVAPILEPGVFEAVDEARKRRKRQHGKTGKRKEVFGLQGRIRCGECGGTMSAQQQRRYRKKNGKGRPGPVEDAERQRRWLAEYLANGYNGAAAARLIKVNWAKGFAARAKARWLPLIEAHQAGELSAAEAVASIPTPKLASRRYYYCRAAIETLEASGAPERCTHRRMVKVEPLHEAVRLELCKLFSDEQLLHAAFNQDEPEEDRSADVERLQTKLQRAEAAYLEGVFDLATLAKRKREIEAELSAIPRPTPRPKRPDFAEYRARVLSVLERAPLYAVMEAAGARVMVYANDTFTLELQP